MKSTIQELAETETPDIQGTSGTFYGNKPVNFVKEVMDGAKKRFFFTEVFSVYNLAPGQSQISIPKRTKYLGAGTGGMTVDTAGTDTHGSGSGTGPYANTLADISWTTVNNTSNVIAEPLPYVIGVTLRRYDIRSSLLDWVQWAKDELSYAVGDHIDSNAAKLFGTSDGLTFAQSGTAGATQLYGGDATADSGLAVGDTLTTDLLVDADRYLKSTQNWYRNGGSGLSGTLTYDSTVLKNGWYASVEEPHVFFIGPAQEAAYKKDSQFTNASEYGSQEIVLNGEIGRYQNIKMVVTNNVESVTAASTGPDNTTVASGVTMTRCVLVHSKKCGALVYGMQPSIEAFEYLSRDQIRIGAFFAYVVKVVHSDAVVCVDVSDN